jgi:hypothetical protein
MNWSAYMLERRGVSVQCECTEPGLGTDYIALHNHRCLNLWNGAHTPVTAIYNSIMDVNCLSQRPICFEPVHIWCNLTNISAILTSWRITTITQATQHFSQIHGTKTGGKGNLKDRSRKTLMMEAILSSETSGFTRATRRNVPQNNIFPNPFVLGWVELSPLLLRPCIGLKNGVFWDVTPCGSCKNRRFGGTYRLHHQGDKNRWTRNNASLTSNRCTQRASVASYG